MQERGRQAIIHIGDRTESRLLYIRETGRQTNVRENGRQTYRSENSRYCRHARRRAADRRTCMIENGRQTTIQEMEAGRHTC
jgi:hypothetical protein